MGFRCGIVGLPNVGKSTLFNAITSAHAEASNYPFCTIDPNIGVVAVPDPRLAFLTSLYTPGRTVPTTIEFVDIAGLVKGASKGEGLGNQFLAHIREVDAIVHVVRCFDDANVVHVDGSVDPARDIGVVETELMLKDLETVERRAADAHKRAKSGEKKPRVEAEFCERLAARLAGGRLARTAAVHNEEEKFWLRDLHLLTDKPVMYVCNTGESKSPATDAYIKAVLDFAALEHATVVNVSAEIEAEISELPPDERRAFIEQMGIAESGLQKVIRAGYGILSLITFFTVNPKELHAWTIQEGTRAPGAAGVVHSDFERGFIRAEVVRYEDLARLGSDQAVRDQGHLLIEGRDYVVRDGDILYFRFTA